ncbi:18.1 kDa class I heat shock protein-like [Solanum dulcamara]|uniref:18.1 kDa class I heat shock protein-like n=1 Tax=Solanum dulcamara TaxID=45834 RepID=UPI0024862EF5|nr:18.1 kDa class I heat shock protein-like [Solanum dulcamara]
MWSLLSSSDPMVSMMNMCPVLSTPIDWKETPEAHCFFADLPGLNKEDVKVEVDKGRVLQISGKWKAEEELIDEKEKKNLGMKWHIVERNRGEFCRKFRLPQNIKADQVKASMENGVLIVTVPKEDVKKPFSKLIEIEEK